MTRRRSTWRVAPVEPPHPVDVTAAALRGSTRPREALAEALDELLGEWHMEGLARSCATMADHLRTLGRAAAEREDELGVLARAPVVAPWGVDDPSHDR